MSFNIRYDKPDPGQFNWQSRKGAIAKLINYYAPDIIGTQEGKSHQLLDLHRLLPHYGSIGRDRRGTGVDEHCAIFYRNDRLKCGSAGDFWLSETPEVVGSITPGWGNPYPRIVTWGRFVLSSGSFLFYNTHLDYYGLVAREAGAATIRNHFSGLDLTDDYLFLTGDFNANPNTLPRQILAQPLSSGYRLKDLLTERDLEAQMTYNGFRDGATMAIDTIYHDSRLQPVWSKIDSDRWLDVLPSDHYPVIAEFNI